MKITLAAVAIILLSAIAWALDDTQENRSREADRYFIKYPLQTRLQQPIEESAHSLPAGVRQKYRDLVVMNFDITTLEKAMKDSMIKHFTADELKALADSDDPAVRKSIVQKSDAYMSEVERAFGVGEEEALAKASPEIIRAILNDGRLGIRVKERCSAVAAKDARKDYEMESPTIRRGLPFEEWKKNTIYHNPQQRSGQKVSPLRLVRGELDKICSCGPFGSTVQTFRCALLVRATAEDSKGKRKPIRFLEMWESVDGEWYFGIEDPLGLQECP